MPKRATLNILANLEQEMAQAGRAAEQAALGEALGALRHPPRELLTIRRAAERLDIPIRMVKRWIEWGTLYGGPINGRWLVAAEDVERVLRVRRTLAEIQQEGFPTDEELRALYDPSRHSPVGEGVGAP